MNKQCALFNSPIGTIKIEADEKNLLSVEFIEEKANITPNKFIVSEILKQALKELSEYFDGKRKSFSVPIKQAGTEFQSAVWKSLTLIPYAKVASYQDIATSIDNPKSVRAVGRTNGLNNIPIIVPCHRVIGKNGKMVGYSSGVRRKEWLLAHEQKHK